MSERTRRALEDLVLPTLPRLLGRYRELLVKPDIELEDLEKVASEDPPIAARVLRLANSAAFGQRQPVTDLKRAAVLLGARALRDLVLQASYQGQFDTLVKQGYELEMLWRHSTLVAFACRSLAQRARTPQPLNPNQLYTLGLLHEIGRLVLLANLGDRYLSIMGGMIEGGESVPAREHAAMGFDHGAVGARILESWGLPAELSEPLRQQHAVRVGTRLPTAILQCADDLVAFAQFGRQVPGGKVMLDHFQRELGLDEEQIAQIRDDLIRLNRELEKQP